MEWTEAGVAGAFRFTQRVFRLVDAVAAGGPDAGSGRDRGGRSRLAAGDAPDDRRGDGGAGRVRLQRRRGAAHEFANAIADAERGASGEPGMAARGGRRWRFWRACCRPMMPHLAEELHARLHPGRPPGRGSALAGGGRLRCGGRGSDHRGAGHGQAAGHDRGCCRTRTASAGDRGGGSRAECRAGCWRASASSSASMCRTGSSISWSRAEMMRRQSAPCVGRRACSRCAGCGFRPVYMPTASGKPGIAQRELGGGQCRDHLPDRPGQLLRQALQQRLDRPAPGSPANTIWA